ncbi:acyl-ACP--UDP-N-acetylglucosamine O-acyltransferase [Sediminitomix flava]|uniref:Acyl-[acyl-carrier-protein]--UDP-N-acetylglucosamine O-acyltransferase n=1 Tax=Sediminitomix flava TaxID=379075 RepID=A0A316A4W7_SEDFL|nr:acyl-ACP--UDP-N-acetylglucosamine O-acyltransferase [Sediminitomix flava]PWJ44807.1 acyl-[acyl-carrier-protein]--UDP-N-acetylglucosamine O-acyltransferase [Sediminitomix flava]
MISPLASIDPNAKIDEGVEIGPFTTVYGDVEIGKGTWIGPNVTIMDGARIGENCKIFPGAVISAVPQDLKFEGEYTTTVIGNNTVLRECVTINRGTSDKMMTKIGENCLLMAYVHVAHDCIIANNCIFSNAVQIAGHVEIDEFTIVGGTAAIHQFVKIGKHAFVAGGSLVRKDVPPFVKAANDPLSYCGVNGVGLRRRGFNDEEVRQIHEMYRTFYAKGLRKEVAIQQIEDEVHDCEAKNIIVDFLKNATRGVIKGY